jgi:cardiolipin synthase
MLVSIYIALALVGAIPLWLVILVVSRDIMIVSAVILSWLIGKPVALKPLAVSKFNTVAQIVLALLVIAALGFDFNAQVAIVGLTALVAVLTSLSVGFYVAEWVRHMNAAESEH